MARKGSYADRRLAEISAAEQAEATPDAPLPLPHVAMVAGQQVHCESAEAAADMRAALQRIHDVMFRTGAL